MADVMSICRWCKGRLSPIWRGSHSVIYECESCGRRTKGNP